MKKVSTALVAAGLFALVGCGGSEQNGAANAVDEVNVAADDLTATENLGGGDTLGNQANALEAESGNVANAAEANLTGTGNGADNAAVNAASNSQ